VSMLDKNVDARTRHLLVRKDVEAFENRCGSVDPDATAAFKTLLQSDRDAANRPRVEPKSVEEKAKGIARKPETRTETREAEAHEAVAPAKSVQHDPAMSDSDWLAAVRGALTSNEAEPAKPARPEPAGAPAAKTPVLFAAPIAHAARRPELLLEAPRPANAPPVSAPALPPPANVATVPAAPPDADHPVPPAAVPELAQAQPHGWVSHIPFVGQILDKN